MQHGPPGTSAWELLLQVRPKAVGPGELNSSNTKAVGQANFKLVYKALLVCWLFWFQALLSLRSPSYLLSPTHAFSSSPPNKSANKWLRHLKWESKKKKGEKKKSEGSRSALALTCHTYASKSHSLPRQCYIVLAKAVCTSAFQHRDWAGRALGPGAARVKALR